MSVSPYFVDVELIQIEKTALYCAVLFCYITKMLQKYSIKFCNRSSVLRQSAISASSTTLSQITKKLLNICSLTFTMQISTTARQTSNCMQIITYHVARLRTNHFQNTPCPAVSNFLDFKWIQREKTELSCAIFQIIVLLYCFALVQLFYNL